MNEATMLLQGEPLIRMALAEDITGEDVSTNAVVEAGQLGEVQLLAKEAGILCGLGVFERTFQLLDKDVLCSSAYGDGDRIQKGDLLATVTGDMRTLLSGERVALNFLQRMSGIATHTERMASMLQGTKTALLDTRKTTPNNRIFEKYAVKVGGGRNHRYNLSDGVLLKDNHIAAAGSIAKAVAQAKDYAPFVRKIEVETETPDMVKEAVKAGADIIMLDNMSPAQMGEAIAYIRKENPKIAIECSGNVTEKTLRTLVDLGVDYISSGALTHSAPVLDLSLKNLRKK